MESIKCDVAIIGSGPAGQSAAVQAAKLGKRVVVIDKAKEPGGTSLHSGTIPSKTMREAIVDLTNFHSRTFFEHARCARPITIDDLTYRLNRVWKEEETLLQNAFQQNNISLLQGSARFENKNCLIVLADDDRLLYEVQSQIIMIATGSTPRDPTHIPFDGKVILDSTALLQIDRIPESMVVVGSGIIGSEYASFFAALGTKVSVIDRKERMLGLLDKEMGQLLQSALESIGLEFHGNKELESIQRSGHLGVVTTKDGWQQTTDTVLYALGRAANVQGLHLENIGIELDHTGHIPVNALFQTNVANIYAIGDVIGPPGLASTSYEQGRLAARYALGVLSHPFPPLFPIGIYTIPEISSIGYTEEQLIEHNFHYETGRAYYRETARGNISGSVTGMFKILFHPETLHIWGIHIIGHQATELIHIGQMAMGQRAPVSVFVDNIFNFPTFAEGYRIAALNGINKLHRHI